MASRIEVLHEVHGYYKNLTYRAIKRDGLVEIQRKKWATNARWITKRRTSLCDWKASYYNLGLAYEDWKIKDLLDR